MGPGGIRSSGSGMLASGGGTRSSGETSQAHRQAQTKAAARRPEPLPV